MKPLRFAVPALLAMAGIVLALILAEAGFRVFAWARGMRAGDLATQLARSADRPLESGDRFSMSGLVRPSPHGDVVYELKPGTRGIFQRQPLHINSRGLRDREYSLRKPPGTFRLVGLGDSVMFGWGVREEESYLAVLERRLNSLPPPHPRFEVLNFAVPGYNTAIEVAVLRRKALAVRPDAVVIHFVNNDFAVPLFLQRGDTSSPGRSYVLDFLRSRFGTAPLSDSLVGVDLRDVPGEDRSRVLKPYQYMVGESGFRRAMDRLARIAGRHGIPVIVILGSAYGRQGQIVRDVTTRHGFELVEIKPYTDAWLREHGVPDEVRAKSAALTQLPVDGHPNARAHEIFATALLDRLTRMGVVRAAP
jgi:lysophospholipase L1-like esterase